MLANLMLPFDDETAFAVAPTKMGGVMEDTNSIKLEIVIRLRINPLNEYT